MAFEAFLGTPLPYSTSTTTIYCINNLWKMVQHHFHILHSLVWRAPHFKCLGNTVLIETQTSSQKQEVMAALWPDSGWNQMSACRRPEWVAWKEETAQHGTASRLCAASGGPATQAPASGSAAPRWSEVSPWAGGGGCVLGHQLSDLPDEVGLFRAAFARLAPLFQNLLQILDLQFLQVHRAQVHLLVCTIPHKRFDSSLFHSVIHSLEMRIRHKRVINSPSACLGHVFEPLIF